MWLSIILSFVAVSISAVAAYYSIVGLTAIFSGAVIPIIIMGIVLEVGKIAAVVWLHIHWNRCGFKFKAYLVPAVLTLMLITSMGIFGFLSRAHIEQTANASENIAQVERIESELERQNNLITRSETKIKELEQSNITQDTSIQEQIDKEQVRIDSAYSRIQPSIDDQKQIIKNQTVLYSDQLDDINKKLDLLQSYIDNNEVAKAQSIIGAKADGAWGPKTAEAIRIWQELQSTKKAELIATIEEISKDNRVILTARKEIRRLRDKAEAEIQSSNKLINQMREKIGQNQVTDNTQELIDEQLARIKSAGLTIEELLEKKFKAESETRKLEAEVGPIKYIAEVIYSDEKAKDKNLLEDAVRIVIIIIVLVFDPLAIVLILAATSGFEWARVDEPNTEKGIKRKQKELQKKEEQLKAMIEKENSEVLELTNALDTMNTELSQQLGDEKTRADKAESEVKEWKDSVFQHSNEVTRLNSLLEENEKKLKDAYQSRDKLAKEIDQIAKDMDVVDQELNKVSELNTTINSLQTDNARLKQELGDAHKKYRVLEGSINTDTVGILQKQVNRLREENGNLHEKLKNSTNEILADENQKLKAQIVTLLNQQRGK